MHFKSFLLLAVAAAMVRPAFAQSDDFGIWSSLGAEKKITKAFSAEAAFDFRSGDNLEQATRWSGSLGLNYKVLPFLKVGAGYVYIHDYSGEETKVNLTPKGKVNGFNVDHGDWLDKHRVYFDLTGSMKLGRLKLSLRERYQFTHTGAYDVNRSRFRDEVQDGYTGDSYEWMGQNFYDCTVGPDHKSSKDKHYLRTRVKAEYNIHHSPFNPFVSYELSNDLSDGLDLDKTRLVVGTEWKITKQHVVSLGYLFQQQTDGKHEGKHHVLDIGYRFAF